MFDTHRGISVPTLHSSNFSQSFIVLLLTPNPKAFFVFLRNWPFPIYSTYFSLKQLCFLLCSYFNHSRNIKFNDVGNIPTSTAQKGLRTNKCSWLLRVCLSTGQSKAQRQAGERPVIWALSVLGT